MEGQGSLTDGRSGLEFAILLVLQILDNQVVMVRTKDKEGYYALQIGAINHPKLKNVSCVWRNADS
jgi:ribosomal protein L3